MIKHADKILPLVEKTGSFYDNRFQYVPFTNKEYREFVRSVRSRWSYWRGLRKRRIKLPNKFFPTYLYPFQVGGSMFILREMRGQGIVFDLFSSETYRTNFRAEWPLVREKLL